MNRNDEFLAMTEELNQPVPGLETTLDRAYKKKRKKTLNLIVHPLGGLAACFTIFVLLVNFCIPVAYACSQIPGLRELAAAVTFSRSLTDAVENEYVQPMDLSQTQNDITAEIAYLIVDQKQVNVFYRLDSDKYEKLYADPDVRSADGNRPESCSCHSTGFDAENGELRCLSIDFVDNAVPNKLIIALRVNLNTVVEEVAPEHSADDLYSDNVYEELSYLAEFEFLLEFDPKFTTAGKIFPVNQTVILEGQEITITDIEVYPTHMRVEIAESPDNTAWLKDLDFYIETDWGMKFDAASGGIISTGSTDSPSMVSYRADSTYFYKADHLKLVITGAQWLRKDMETTYLNLVTGEHGVFPEDVFFESAEQTKNGWVVKFRAMLKENGAMYQPFDYQFYDIDGNAYMFNEWCDEEGSAGDIPFFHHKFPLKNYPYDEVWLSPQFSHYWTAENQIVITIQ